MPHTPTPSQRAAIEAEPKPLLVVAGPGSGKTFCLIERIHFLITWHEVAPERICAFTFTNKAAEEIAARLDQLGPKAALVKRTTIHKFCVDLLREHGRRVGVEPGFGIADDEYQLQVLWRLEANPKKREALLKRFSLHRLRGDELYREATTRLHQYEDILKKQNLLDFDMLLLKARDLMLHVEDVADAVRARWASVLEAGKDQRPAYIAPITVPTIYHLAKRSSGIPAASAVTADLMRLLYVANLDNYDYYDALQLRGFEYEDALQFVTCRRVGARFLVTRDDMGMKRAPVHRRTAAEMLPSFRK